MVSSTTKVDLKLNLCRAIAQINRKGLFGLFNGSCRILKKTILRVWKGCLTKAVPMTVTKIFWIGSEFALVRYHYEILFQRCRREECSQCFQPSLILARNRITCQLQVGVLIASSIRGWLWLGPVLNGFRSSAH